MQHPDFPIDFKPELAFFNYDQLCDLIWLNETALFRGGTVSWTLLDKFKTTPDNSFIFGQPFYANLIYDLLLGKPVLFERFSALKPTFYAQDYSWQLFQVLRKYADNDWFTSLRTVYRIIQGVGQTWTRVGLNGRLTPYDKLNDYGENYPYPEIDSKYHVEDALGATSGLQILLNSIPERPTDIYLSWLAYSYGVDTPYGVEGSSLSGEYDQNKIALAEYQTAFIPAGEPTFVYLNSVDGFCPCSMIAWRLVDGVPVIAEDFYDYLDTQSEGLSYRNWNNFLNHLDTIMGDWHEATKMNKGMVISLNNGSWKLTGDILATTIPWNGRIAYAGDTITGYPALQSDTRDFDYYWEVRADLVDLPDWYQQPVFRKANNNYWNEIDISSAEDTGNIYFRGISAPNFSGGLNVVFSNRKKTLPTQLTFDDSPNSVFRPEPYLEGSGNSLQVRLTALGTFNSSDKGLIFPTYTHVINPPNYGGGYSYVFPTGDRTIGDSEMTFDVFSWDSATGTAIGSSVLEDSATSSLRLPVMPFGPDNLYAYPYNNFFFHRRLEFTGTFTYWRVTSPWGFSTEPPQNSGSINMALGFYRTDMIFPNPPVYLPSSNIFLVDYQYQDTELSALTNWHTFDTTISFLIPVADRTFNFSWSFQCFYDEEPQDFFDPTTTYLTEQEIANYLQSVMSTVKINEIHAWTSEIRDNVEQIYHAIGAEDGAFVEDDVPVTMHLVRKVDLLCKFFGLAFNFDGSYQTTQSSRYFEAGENLPQGWYVSQTGLTKGWGVNSKTPNPVNLAQLSVEEQQVGLLYDVISNKIEGSDDGTQNIVDGGYVACNNFPQYLRQVLDDFDKMLGGQYLGAGAINRNGRTFVYEGLVNLLQELFASAIDTSASVEETKIAVGISQQLVKEVMRGLGLPVATKTFEYELEARDPQSEEIDPLDPPVGAVPVYYSGYAEGTPTLADLIFAVLANVGLNNASSFTLKQSQQENIEEQVNK